MWHIFSYVTTLDRKCLKEIGPNFWALLLEKKRPSENSSNKESWLQLFKGKPSFCMVMAKNIQYFQNHKILNKIFFVDLAQSVSFCYFRVMLCVHQRRDFCCYSLFWRRIGKRKWWFSSAPVNLSSITMSC